MGLKRRLGGDSIVALDRPWDSRRLDGAKAMSMGDGITSSPFALMLELIKCRVRDLGSGLHNPRDR